MKTITQSRQKLIVIHEAEMRKDDPYISWVGKRVSKRKKPFKSGNKTNTVSGITINPNTGKHAFVFEEDDSIVDANICEIIEE